MIFNWHRDGTTVYVWFVFCGLRRLGRVALRLEEVIDSRDVRNVSDQVIARGLVDAFTSEPTDALPLYNEHGRAQLLRPEKWATIEDLIRWECCSEQGAADGIVETGAILHMEPDGLGALPRDELAYFFRDRD